MKTTWLVGAALAVLLTLAFTVQFGAVNQATYLLDPLHRALPELFHRDWFVHDTPSYQPAFGWLVQWLFRLDPEGPIAIVTAHIAIAIATFLALTWLVTALAPAWQAIAIVLVAAVTLGISMGGSYLLAGYFQPSSLATLGWLIAMAALVRRRYLLAGLALAIGGIVHVNFLVLGVGLFTLAALAARATWRELAMLVAPQLVVLACFAPLLVGATGPSKLALHILVDFHAPVHYAPKRLVTWIAELAAWQLAAFAALRLATPTREARTLWWFSLIGLAITAGSALVMRAGWLSLTQLFCARIAPFEQLACQVLVASALVAADKTRRAWIAVAIAVALLVVWHFLRYAIPLWAVVVAIATIAAIVIAPPRIAHHVTTALAIYLVAAALWKSPRGSGLTTLPYASPTERSLTSWAREHTDVDALFLVPPGMGRFRLLARRAVIADTKSPPLRPDLLVEWYRRLCAMVKLPDAETFQAIEARYAQLSAADLDEIAHAFGADYIIASPGAMPAAPVFANEEYAVYRAR